MQSAQYVPKPPLSEFIECLWWHEIPGYQGRELILPSPYIELIINFGNPHKVFRDSKLERFEWQKESWLAGMQTRFLAIESTSSHMIGARFKPGGAHAFFDFPISTISDKVIPLGDLWGESAVELGKEMRGIEGIEERFAFFEARLLVRLRAKHAGYERVKLAIAKLEDTQGRYPIQQLAADLNLSHKHFTDEFQWLVGVRPKQYARMVRFNRALAALDPSRPIDWKLLAHHAEFFDQSHFINEFRAFTGLTPTKYHRLWQQLHGQMGEFDPRFVPLG